MSTKKIQLTSDIMDAMSQWFGTCPFDGLETLIDDFELEVWCQEIAQQQLDEDTDTKIEDNK